MWSVIGQKRAVSLLQRGLETGSLSHAYLFVGLPHVGKMTLAKDLAKVLNCESVEKPCGECESCKKIESGNHPDVQVIGLTVDPESKAKAEISIEQIRDMQHNASLPPFEGKYKVYIIDGAEYMSTEAANCLLKTLEEPVGKVVFILLTANEKLLLTTVVSRCQKVELLPLPAAEIEQALISGWNVEPQKARLLSRLSHGCLGWAVNARDEAVLQRRTERVDELLDMVEANNAVRFTLAAQLASGFSQNRAVVQERLDLWLDWWHDLLLVKAGLESEITNVDRLTELQEMAAGYSLGKIKSFIDSIRAAGEQLKLNANPQLVLEVLMLNIPENKKRREKITA